MSRLAINLGLPFTEAIGWAGKRVSVLPDEFYADIQAAYRKGAFTVSGITNVGMLNEILKSLNDAIREGKSMREWQKSLPADVMRLTPAHRETIFRNAVQSGYAAGRWGQQQRQKALRPILMYDAINDSRTRPTHRALDGFMAPVDDPVWRRIYPPNGHNCRCNVISLTEKQARDRGWTGFVRALPAEPDPGWEFNPGLEYQESLDEIVKQQTVEAPLQVVRGMQLRDMLQDARVKAKDYVLGKPDSGGREYGIAINPATGLADGVFEGDSNSINLPPTESNVRALKGSIFFHNHPNSSSLSTADFSCSAFYQMKEMNAVGGDGSWFKSVSPRMSVAEVRNYAEDISKVMKKVEEEIFPTLRPLFALGKITSDEAGAIHYHMANEALGAKGLVRYEVVQTGSRLGKAMLKAANLFDVDALRARLATIARNVKTRKYAFDN